MPNSKRGDRERRRVVGSARNRGARVPEPGYFVGLVAPPAYVANLMAPGDQSVGGSVVRVQLERVLQKPLGDPGVRRDHRHHARQSAQIEVIGVEVFGTLSLGAFNLRLLQARLNDADHFFGDLILQVENLLQFSVVSVGPKMRTGFGFEQLGGDAHAVPRLANSPLQHIAHAQLTPNLPHIDGFALVDEARIARDYEQPFDPR